MSNTPQSAQANAPQGGIEPADELYIANSRTMRCLYIGAGFVSLTLGIIGLLLPIFPTSPFLILAAAAFARGSERCYHWLLNNRYCGQTIRSWRNNEGLTIRAKSLITLAIIGSLAISTLFFVPFIPVKIILTLIGMAVTVYIWRQPTKRSAHTTHENNA